MRNRVVHRFTSLQIELLLPRLPVLVVFVKEDIRERNYFGIILLAR